MASDSESTPEAKLFGSYFNDVEGLQRLMKEKRMIASGSAVLYALESEASWTPSDLDLFAGNDIVDKQGLIDVHEYFRAEGYQVADAKSPYAKSKCFDYYSDMRKTHVQLVLSYGSAVRNVLTTFWSTPILNIATWESIYSLFPTTALEERKMYVLEASTCRQLKAYDKYLNRGFTRCRFDTVKHHAEYSVGRYIGDAHTKRVPFVTAPSAVEDWLKPYVFTVSEEGLKLDRPSRQRVSLVSESEKPAKII